MRNGQQTTALAPIREPYKPRNVCEAILDMGDIAEACPLGLTPTSSMAVMLAISDAVAVALMEQKGVTKADWGKRHHGGYLGRMARTDNLPH